MALALERAARALALSYYEDGKADNPSAYWAESPEQMAEWSWDQWTPQARAVLMAVRDDPGAHWHEDGRANFAAFIDAILNEKE